MNVNTPVIRRLRRKRPKGIWMRSRDPELLKAYMVNAKFNQSRLADYVDSGLKPKGSCCRQYIHLLATGKRRSCSKDVASLIEEALRVLPGTLFVEEKSPSSRPAVARKKTAA
jgi:hypothetical protein